MLQSILSFFSVIPLWKDLKGFNTITGTNAKWTLVGLGTSVCRQRGTEGQNVKDVNCVGEYASVISSGVMWLCMMDLLCTCNIIHYCLCVPPKYSDIFRIIVYAFRQCIQIFLGRDFCNSGGTHFDVLEWVPTAWILHCIS